MSESPQTHPDNSQPQMPNPSVGAQWTAAGYPQSAYPQPTANPHEYTNVAQKPSGFFSALFNLNFDRMVTLPFAKFIYTLYLSVVLGIAALLWIIPIFSGRVGGFYLLFGWIPIAVVALMIIIPIRLGLEFLVASVKTAENTSRLVEQARQFPRG